MTEVVLLGSGAADGWPNPFCRCASCTAARDSGERRGHSSALIDGTVLIDCGPDVLAAATHAGVDLAGVRYLLLTHDHFDHLAGQALLIRSWAGACTPLDVIGPPAALAACRAWIADTDPVRLRPVAAGDEVTLTGNDGDYRVHVLTAAHTSTLGEPAVLYDVTALDEHGDRAARLLWAADTGPLPAATLDALTGTELDLLLLEETFGRFIEHGADHHDLDSFPRTLAALRSAGAVTTGTRVIAVHLSHHNPPPAQLAEVLAEWGAEIGVDGMRLPLPDEAATAVSPPTGRTLVLGAVRSGKSVHAETLLADQDSVLYIATGGTRDGDAEWAERVALHRSRRPASWRTAETLDVATALDEAAGPVLIDCLGTWLTGMMDRHELWSALERSDDGDRAPLTHAMAELNREVDGLIAAWRRCPHRVVAVSNEVGSGVVPATAAGRVFRDELGRLNTRLSVESEQVVLVVAGRTLPLP
ncbi:bifunctional adenosylcobinamide kinase/adenosylcobinamide-phosphate guanylyltransferase [Gordonia phosphorivorans]|uniref:Adenosylcobinamide kinase n=1 Tax=Gordonia phosphorivorans TaxID=1056982 RepID=A0ABV6HCD4_9ACTN